MLSVLKTVRGSSKPSQEGRGLSSALPSRILLRNLVEKKRLSMDLRCRSQGMTVGWTSVCVYYLMIDGDHHQTVGPFCWLPSRQRCRLCVWFHLCIHVSVFALWKYQ